MGLREEEGGGLKSEEVRPETSSIDWLGYESLQAQDPSHHARDLREPHPPHIVPEIERKLPPKKAQKMQVLMLGALQRFLAPDRLQIRMLANSPKGNTYPLGDDVAGSMMGLR